MTISRTSHFDAADLAGLPLEDSREHSRFTSGIDRNDHTALADDTEFAVAGDRLVRHLFDVGLQLPALRVVFEQCGDSDTDRRAARDAVTGMLDDLGLLIRDSNLALLAAESGEERE